MGHEACRRLTRMCALVLAVSCACRLVGAQARDPVSGATAVVTDIAAPAERRVGERAVALQILDDLHAGDDLRLGAGARLEIAFTGGNGQVVTLCGPGRYRLQAGDVSSRDPGACIARRDLAAQWRTVRIAPGAVARASISLRGAGATQVALIEPRGSQRAPGPRRFAWNAPYGRAGGPWDYALRLSDASGRLLLDVHTAQRSLGVPAQIDWQTGQPYLWSIDAAGADGRRVSGAAEFVVLDPAALADIDTLELSLRRQAADRDDVAGTDGVLLGLALEASGLHDEAMRQWRSLARERAPLRDLLPAQP